ncbi:hypothetical protein PYCC9005_005460 [Savitreella phatthalungensis]
MSVLRDWVSDQLQLLVGGSERHVEDFIIASAQRADHADGLATRLEDVGLPQGPAAQRFSRELLARIASRPGHESTPSQHASEVRAADSEDGRATRKRIASSPHPAESTSARPGTKRHDSERHAVDQASTERHDSARHATERKDPERHGSDRRGPSIAELRVRARQEYLKKRLPQQIALLKEKIKIEEELLSETARPTRSELYALRVMRDTLRAYEDEDRDVRAYTLPQDTTTDSARREGALFSRYNDHDKGDEDSWERERTKAAPRVKEKPDDHEYDYVFDDSAHIDFVVEDALAGSDEPEGPLIAAESIREVRESLPMFRYRTELLDAMQRYQVLIVVGETGSGKTTQLPQYLDEAGFTQAGKVACTQPRRVAAMSVAARVAEEMGCKLGDDVGYSVRFEDVTSERTRIKYMTDGMLLREFMTEPSLSQYSVLIIDEAHERTLATDILFALVKDITKFRPDFKLIISSATLDAQKFSDYFDDAPIFRVPGRKFPVDIHYTAAPEANYLHAAITTIFQIHTTQPAGDILVFLTGQDEIEAAAENMAETCRKLGSKVPDIIIAPIYAGLPSELQSKIFERTPAGARKVVLATNIAETSITIDGVVYVIDPGFNKENRYNPKTGMSSLVVSPCSRAAVDQRAGRAGRSAPGKCFRLFTKWAYLNELERSTTPEIQRTNLGNVLLLLKSIGINELLDFDFLDKPPAETLMRSLEQLYALGALNVRGELTKVGRQMAEFPMDPMLSRSVLAAQEYGCADGVLTIVAMLQEAGQLFYRPKDRAYHADQARKGFTRPEGDHLTLLAVYRGWQDAGYSRGWCRDNFVQFKSLCRARDVRRQLERLIASDDTTAGDTDREADPEAIRRALTRGFFYNAAKLAKDGSYKNLKTSQQVFIHPSSVLHTLKPKYVLYHELVLTTKEYMRSCLDTRPEWLLTAAPHFFSRQEVEDLERARVRTVGRASR